MQTDFFDQVRACYTGNRQGLYSYALALTRNRAAAEDMVHAVVCRLLARGKMPREVRPYLFRAVRNAVVDDWRRNSSRENQPGDSDLAGAVITEQPDQALQLHQCLFRLEEAEREVIVLKVYQGLTFREIGIVRDQPANTAASHYRRGLEKMKTMLEEEA
jgi:RNA polymerase sigma-70 factor (ECF subfamily)